MPDAKVLPPQAPSELLVNGEKSAVLEAGAYAELTWPAVTIADDNPFWAYEVYQNGVLIGETLGLYWQLNAPWLYGATYTYTVRTRCLYSTSTDSPAVTITILTTVLPPKSAETVTEFLFFDRNDQLQFIRDDAISLTVTEEEYRINGSFPYNAQKPITNGMRIGWMETDGFQMFEIRQPTTNAVTLVQSFEGEHVCLAELLDAVVDDLIVEDATAKAAAQLLLSKMLLQTDWHLGYTSGGTVGHTVHFAHVSVWAALLTIRDTWGVVISPRLVYTYNGIERYVDVLERRGQNRGVRLALNVNVQQAGVTYDDRTLYTALYGLGADDDAGQQVTMADASWNTASGDPANKPYGQQWIEDEQATAAWGRKGRRREGVVRFDVTDPYELVRLTWEALQECKKPKVTINMTALELSALGYSKQGIFWGDDVICVLDPIGLEVQLRVTQNTRDVIRAENSKPTIGEYRPDIVYKFAAEKRS